MKRYGTPHEQNLSGTKRTNVGLQDIKKTLEMIFDLDPNSRKLRTRKRDRENAFTL